MNEHIKSLNEEEELELAKKLVKSPFFKALPGVDLVIDVLKDAGFKLHERYTIIKLAKERTAMESMKRSHK